MLDRVQVVQRYARLRLHRVDLDDLADRRIMMANADGNLVDRHVVHHVGVEDVQPLRMGQHLSFARLLLLKASQRLLVPFDLARIFINFHRILSMIL